MPQQTEKWANIRLKDSIPSDVRTEGKDDAAEKIQTLIDENKWPVSLSRLDDETEWSRSHYRNVLDQYFEPVDEKETIEHGNQEITVPKDVDKMSFLRGYISCLQNGQ